MREGGSTGGFGPRGWNVVTWLLVVNVAVFVVQTFLLYNPQAATNPLALSLEAVSKWQLWTFVTYQFSHFSLLHLLGNMIGLYFLGGMLLNLVGPKHLLYIYFLGGFAGGILQLLFSLMMGQDAQIIGASASVMAIVLAVATLIPHQTIQLLLFFIIPIKMTMRQIALLVIAINALTVVYQLVASPTDGVATAAMAHFGGIGLGWAYVRYWLPSANDRLRGKSKKKPRRKGFGIKILRDGDSGPAGKSPDPKQPFVATDVDAVLDKINEQGFQSLSDDERHLLERSSRKLSDRIDRDS